MKLYRNNKLDIKETAIAYSQDMARQLASKAGDVAIDGLYWLVTRG